MTDRTFCLVVPDTVRSGPGTSSHVSFDGGESTLCKVENNARGLRLPRSNAKGYEDLEEALAHQRRSFPRRDLCRNCESLYYRRTEEDRDEG